MAMKFEHGALGLVGALVVGLVAANVIRPPLGETSAPSAVSRVAAPAPVPVRPGKSQLPGLQPAAGMAVRPTVRKLSDAFQRMGYDLQTVLSGDGRVPRLFLAGLPSDLADVRDTTTRKAIFFQTVLPLILQINEEILAERRRLWQLRHHLRLGERLNATDRLWLAVMAERYRVKRGDIDALLNRVDIVPVSLALAQSAEESGWGTSRFGREGNALFGMWTTARDGGMTPLNRDQGKTHKIKAYGSLLESVRSYVRNLNRHGAYKQFRSARAGMRRAGAPLEGAVLAGELTAYSQRGADYVATIRTIIEANGLSRLDDARLSETGTAAKPSI
ncbi:MAG: glucosaminidase domain-containing protein [Proteobacteria bacterium]|nr:glucosaminidase domain-containing protein [Pseudomonadota bacterium]